MTDRPTVLSQPLVALLLLCAAPSRASCTRSCGTTQLTFDHVMRYFSRKHVHAVAGRSTHLCVSATELVLSFAMAYHAAHASQESGDHVGNMLCARNTLSHSIPPTRRQHALSNCRERKHTRAQLGRTHELSSQASCHVVPSASLCTVHQLVPSSECFASP